MDNIPIYNHEESENSDRSAKVILPLVFSRLNVRSILDVGCGLGEWLAVAEKLGVSDFLGIDGDYVVRSKLKIPIDKFLVRDLRLPFEIGRQFDLIICLEVAEHLPDSSADTLVRNLVTHGNAFLFSAAIPNQTGLHHINEQWPEYWRVKFEKYGYFVNDVLRPKIWDDADVEWWYRQNIFLITKEYTPTIFGTLSIVHPLLFRYTIDNHKLEIDSIVEGRQGMRLSFKIFVRAIVHLVRRMVNIER